MEEPRPVRVAVQGGFFNRRNRTVGTRQDRKLEEHLEADRAAYSSCLYKIQVTNISDTKNTNRPVPTRCIYCYDKGFARLVRKKYDAYGVRNSLNRCTGLKASGGSIASPFEGLQKCIQESGGDHSNWMFRLVMTASGWFIYFLFRSKFEAVCIHDGQLQLLKDFPTVHPVIYVPLRRSFMDHFLISWATLQSSGRIPAFIPNFTKALDPFIRVICKLWKGIVLTEPNKSIGNLSRMTLVEQAAIQYVSENMKAVIRLEYPLEVEASKTGKPTAVPEGTEFFKFMIQNVIDQKFSDTLFIPVSVTYEKMPEEPKSSKILETIWNIFVRPLRSRSIVRINFSYPISVRELLVSFQTSKKVVAEEPLSPDSRHNSLDDEDKVDLNDIEASVSEMNPVYDTQVIQKATSLLSSHTLYDALRSTPLMSTHLLSYLMLNVYWDTWVPLEKLIQDFQYYIRLVQESKNDTGFSNLSDCKIVILRAAEILGGHLIHVRSFEATEELYLKAVKGNILELSYYANHVASFFALEAVVITSVLATNRARIETFVDTRIDIEFVESEVVTVAKNLIQLLQSEFIFHPPCISADKAVTDMLGQLQERYFIRVRRGDTHASRYYREQDENLMENIVPGSEKYVVNAVGCEEELNRFKQLCNIVNPYLRCYAVMLEALSREMSSLEDNVEEVSLPETELEAHLLKALKEPEGAKQSQYLAVEQTVKNFVQTLKKLGILRVSLERGKAAYSLCEDFKKKESLAIVCDHILYYL